MAVKRGNSRVRATWQPDWGLVRHLLGAGVAGMVLVGLTGAARHISDPENYPLRTVEIPTRLERVDPALLQARRYLHRCLLYTSDAADVYSV